MKGLLLLALLSFCQWSLAQSKISYYLEVEMSSEYDEIDYESIKEQGWKVKENKSYDTVFVHSAVNMNISELPVRLRLGNTDFTFYIARTTRGAFKSGMSYDYGDSDGEASQDGYLNIGAVNVNYLQGGEYASGAWSVNAKSVVHFKN